MGVDFYLYLKCKRDENVQVKTKADSFGFVIYSSNNFVCIVNFITDQMAPFVDRLFHKLDTNLDIRTV